MDAKMNKKKYEQRRRDRVENRCIACNQTGYLIREYHKKGKDSSKQKSEMIPKAGEFVPRKTNEESQQEHLNRTGLTLDSTGLEETLRKRLMTCWLVMGVRCIKMKSS